MSSIPVLQSSSSYDPLFGASKHQPHWQFCTTKQTLFRCLSTTSRSANGKGNEDGKSIGGDKKKALSLQPSFKVVKIGYNGEMKIVTLRTDEILRASSNVYARDLLALNLTSRQERMHEATIRPSNGAFANAATAASRKDIDAVISPRKGSIVVAFTNIRAVVSRDSVLLFNAHNPSVQEFAQELADSLLHLSLSSSGNYDLLGASSSASTTSDGFVDRDPVELIFMEKVLHDTVDSFNRRLRLFQPIVDSFLDKVNNEVYSDTGVHLMVPLKDALQSFEMLVKQSLDCLTDLLEDDEEMLALLLTEQAEAISTGQQVAFARHEHVELLLGVYARQMNNTLLEIQFLLQRLQSKQEFVALALAGYRNRMVRMNVTISIATLSLCIGTTVAGYFGMNLVNGFEDSPTAFNNVILATNLGGLLIAASSLNYLSGKSMQRRAAQRLEEIETLTSALSDMEALDYVIKSAMVPLRESEDDESNGIDNDMHITTVMDKSIFKSKLKGARQSREVTDAEVDLLFDILDEIRDGQLTNEDYSALQLNKPSKERPLDS